MKFKLGEVWQMSQAMPDVTELQIPVKAGYKLAKALKKITEEAQLVDQQRVALIEKYGEDQGDGNMKVIDANIPKFNEELNVLFEDDVELDIEPISVSSLGDEATLSVQQMVLLEKILVDDE